jgi:hypothetical protein
VSEINRLREELNWYYRQLDPAEPGAPNSARAAGGVEAVLQAIQQREHQLLRAIRQLPDDEYRLLEHDSGITLTRFRAHLQGASWIEYFHRADGYVAVVGDGDDLWVVKLPGERSVVEGALRLLRFQVGQRAMESEHFLRHAAAFQSAADAHLRLLYQELIEPLRPYLRQRRLVIIPHGVLHALPFAALHDGARSLIDDFTITVAPSAAVFALCSQRSASPYPQVLLVAAEPEAARQEMASVARDAPSAVVLEGAAATLDEVKRAAAASRLIHIATHGVFRADNPYFSALQLADGRLNVIDI